MKRFVKQFTAVLVVVMLITNMAGFSGLAFGAGNETTNLNSVLDKIDIVAQKDSSGNYIVRPDVPFELTFHFKETSTKQFANAEEMVYQLPAGLDVGNISNKFDMSVTSGGQTYNLQNDFRVENGKLYVKFDQTNTNAFNALKALANAQFRIKIQGSLDETVTVVKFSDTVTKTFSHNTERKLAIVKNATYNKAKNRIDYVVTVTTTGANKNVVISDEILGTALTLNNDVVLTSNKSDHDLSGVMPTYSGNNFSLTIPTAAHEEVFTVKYSAAVNYDKLNYYGTAEETKNRASAISDNAPKVTAEKSLVNLIKFKVLSKRVVPESTDLTTNPSTLTWEVKANDANKKEMGGKVIKDRIHRSVRHRMNYDGVTGIKVIVKNEAGITVDTRNLTWGSGGLEKALDKNGKQIGWNYTTPNSDGKYSYVITTETKAKMDDIIGPIYFKNTVSMGKYAADATKTYHGDIKIGAAKEATQVSQDKIEWKVTLSVPKEGLDGQTYFYDKLPLYGQYRDTLDGDVDSAVSVSGLLPGETAEPIYKANEGVIRTFFKKSDGKNGLDASAADRQIVIMFKTKVNQQWLDEFVGNYGEITGNYHLDTANKAIHKNSGNFFVNRKASGGTDNISKYVTAKALPRKQSFVKKFLGTRSASDASKYPVFDYELTITNPKDEQVIINDQFNTEFFELYTGNANDVVVKGGTTTSSNVQTAALADGLKMTINLPKNNGKLYDTYTVRYSLVVKDNKLADLNAEALLDNDYKVNNTAEWGALSATAAAPYYPYVDKKLAVTPSNGNQFTATYKIVVNKYNQILGANLLSVKDNLSDKLRAVLDSAKVVDENNNAVAFSLGYDEAINQLAFNDLPNDKKLIITYQAKVLGSGEVTYTNTAELNGFSKKVTHQIVITGSGAGGGVNPSITLVKRDQDNTAKKLPGAKFQLLKDNAPVTDKNGNPVYFITDANGEALVEGNQTNLGWVLTEGANYSLKEVIAPNGYQLKSDPVPFKLVQQPSGNSEYGLINGKLDVTNKRETVSVTATKTWVNGPKTDHILANSNLILSRRVGNGPFEVVNEVALVSGNVHGPFTYVWSDLLKKNEAGELYEYSVEEAAVVNNQIALLNGHVYDVTKNGFDITNTYVPATDAKATASKIWLNGPTADHTEVTINLYREAPQTARELVVVDPADLTVTEDVKGTFNYAWKNLEKTNEYGEEYVFTVEEAGVVNNEIALPNGNVYAVSQQGNVITNSFVVSQDAKVTAEKRWVNGPDSDHTAVTLNLYRQAPSTPKEVVNKAYTSFESVSGVFKYKWEGLDKTNSAGEQYTFTVEEAGATAGKVVVNGRTYTVTQVGNVITNTLPVYHLGDFVWDDLNKDGKQDAGEPGVEGVKVTLTTSNGAIELDTTHTDADGKYLFKDLPDGDYKVKFSELPTGYQKTTSDAGSDDTVDSDGLVATGTINGADNLTLDLGIYKKPIVEPVYNLGNYVWYDKNNNGLQDADEIGVKGVKVKVTSTSGGAITTGGALSLETVTNDDGYYLFEDLVNGEYKVEFGVDDTLPVGYKPTDSNAGSDDTIDSDGLTAIGRINNADNLTLDLGIVKKPDIVKLYNLGDVVWYDKNGNGIQDAGEAGVEGVEVALYDSNGSKLADVKTDSNGLYVFTDLPNGNYTVVFDRLPAGYIPTKTNVGNDHTVDSDGLTPNVTINNADNMTIDLGIVKAAVLPANNYKLGNYVWYDKNENGIQDAGETGVSGVVVTLTKPDGTVLQTTTTDANGLYQFTNLANGDYRVIFTNLPSKYKATRSNRGGDDAKDSDGSVVDVTIANADDMTIDLGIYKRSSGGGSSTGGGGGTTTPTTKPTTTPKVTPVETTNPTQGPATNPTTEPTTEPTTVPTTTEPSFVAGNTPDPNSPDSPDVIVVLDNNGTPLGTYHKKSDPNGGFIYVDDNGVPLGTTKIVKTGNNFPELILIMIAVLALVGAFVLRKAIKKTSYEN